MSHPVFTSLNGRWEVVFDPDNTGRSENWQAAFPTVRSEPIQVPGVIEQVRPGYDGVAWYRTRFPAPAAKEGSRVLIRFGAVSYYCDCWLNGRSLGSHEGGFSRFEFDITDPLHTGENELVVRVINPPSNRKVDGFRSGAPLNQSNIPVGKAAWYFNFGGIWQDVDLIVTSALRVENCFVKPFPFESRASCEIELCNSDTPGPAELRVSVHHEKDRDEEHPLASKTLAVDLDTGNSHIQADIAIANPRLWSPSDPFLYRLSVDLVREDTVIHSHCERFGMREFTIQDGKFLLNREPILLKGFLQQGVYPRTLITPHDRQMAVREFRLLKDNGFNFMRAHLRPPEPWYLDLADEMGILIEGEPAIGWITHSPETEERCRREIESMLIRDRNHPSIVFWCLLNEAYHFLGFTMDQVKNLTRRLAKAARQLDPTRLMMDTSGGGGTGTMGGTSIMLPNSDTTAEMIDAHAYCPIPPRDSDLEAYRTDGQSGTLLFISEFGAPEDPPDFKTVLERYTPAEKEIGLEDYALHMDYYDSLCTIFRSEGLDRIFASPEDLIRRTHAHRADDIRLIMLAQRSNPNLAGTVFCQLADASGEMFGATDIWREKKPSFDALAEACRTPLLAPEANPRVLFPGDQIRLRAVLITEQARGESLTCRLTLVDAENRPLQTFCEKPITPSKSIEVVFEESIQCDDWPSGVYNVIATLEYTGDKPPLSHAVSVRVLEQPVATAKRIAILESDGRMATMADSVGITVDAFSNNYRDKDVPVFLDLRETPVNRAFRAEILGQVRKIVELGGSAVLFEPEPLLLYEHLLPFLIRPEGMMRTLAYARKHPLTEGLPGDDVAGFEYAEVLNTRADKAIDIIAAGGEIVIGALWSHMWTRPADYRHGGLLYTLPLARGQLVICNLDLFSAPRLSPTTQRLFVNLANFASDQIQSGGEDSLLSRCIDPLPADAVESTRSSLPCQKP